MDNRESRLMQVVMAAKALVEQKCAAEIEHLNGHDDIGNEMDNTAWMYYASLEDTVECLEPDDLP